MKIAETVGGYETVKHVVRKLWVELPDIHRHWGFVGTFAKETVYYDCSTRKTTLLNWDRGQIPIYHHPGFEFEEDDSKDNIPA